jgi:predicted Fe-S protein YdhL (DUF1289 family)
MAAKLQSILKARKSTYGDFSDGARFSQACLRAAEVAPSWLVLSDVQKSSVIHILQKLQRIVAGDPNIKDTWDDIAGYATLASDRIIEKKRGRR